MNKKKILILGVGNAQVDAIRYCKSYGHEVHSLSYKPEGAGLKFCDAFELIDIIDKEAVADYCKKNSFDCIYSVGSDIAMPTVGYVAEELGLPFMVDERTAELLSNKLALRNHLNYHNISPIQYMEAGDLSELNSWNTFPAILKPADSQGQRGVYEIISPEDIRKFFKTSISHSLRKRIILEEYVQGKEVSVNAFVYRGKIIYRFISDRRVVEDLPGGIVKGHDFPTTMPIKLQEVTYELVNDTILSLGIQNGPVYYQMKYNEKEVKIIEMAGRLDGCHIWRLIKMNYGVDLLDLTFKKLLGENVNFPEPFERGNMKIDFPLQKPGSSFNKKLHSALLSQSLFSEFYYVENEKVRPVNGLIEKTGIIIR